MQSPVLPHNSATPKRLIIRLSSLGDVILSSAALENGSVKSNPVDWVVAREYALVLRGHPSIRKLWEFDRRSEGLFPWVKLARELWAEGYDEVFDLHGTIRARVLRFLFWFWGLSSARKPFWRRASKQRFRSWGFIWLKALWPRQLLSRKQVSEFSAAAGGTGEERPNLKQLLDGVALPKELEGKRYVCVMPGSNWPGKTWSGEKYFEVIRRVGLFPVVMGTEGDPESKLLVKYLNGSAIPHHSGIGAWNLREVAKVLSCADAYIGSDTGLAHLAEAVGTDIIVLYGPTAPGLGFEPWRSGSRTAGMPLWCRPCGKIGNRCYRPIHKFKCLRELDIESVESVVREKLSK